MSNKIIDFITGLLISFAVIGCLLGIGSIGFWMFFHLVTGK